MSRYSVRALRGLRRSSNVNDVADSIEGYADDLVGDPRELHRLLRKCEGSCDPDEVVQQIIYRLYEKVAEPDTLDQAYGIFQDTDTYIDLEEAISRVGCEGPLGGASSKQRQKALTSLHTRSKYYSRFYNHRPGEMKGRRQNYSRDFGPDYLNDDGARDYIPVTSECCLEDVLDELNERILENADSTWTDNDYEYQFQRVCDYLGEEYVNHSEKRYGEIPERFYEDIVAAASEAFTQSTDCNGESLNLEDIPYDIVTTDEGERVRQYHITD